MKDKTTTPYVVANAPVVDGPLPGTTAWAERAIAISNRSLWNNGTYVKRDMRGKPGIISNHARGLAMDLSYRHVIQGGHAKGLEHGRQIALAAIKQLVARFEVLGLQLVIDYHAPANGPQQARIWKCDRNAWRPQPPGSIHGVPGDWFHLEITPTMAADPARVAAAFRKAFPPPSTTV